MKQNITVLVPSFLMTSIHDYSLVEFIKSGLKNNDQEVCEFKNQFNYSSIDDLNEGFGVFLSSLCNQYQNVNVILFGCSTRLVVSNHVNKLVMVSPNFEPSKEVKSIIKDGLFLEEINGVDYLGFYYNKSFLMSLSNDYDGTYLTSFKGTKIMLNGLLNKYFSQVDAAVFCNEYGVEYLGLEDMDYYVDDFYNREFILEELMNIN